MGHGHAHRAKSARLVLACSHFRLVDLGHEGASARACALKSRSLGGHAPCVRQLRRCDTQRRAGVCAERVSPWSRTATAWQHTKPHGAGRMDTLHAASSRPTAGTRATHAWAHPVGTSRAGWQPSGSEIRTIAWLWQDIKASLAAEHSGGPQLTESSLRGVLQADPRVQQVGTE